MLLLEWCCWNGVGGSVGEIVLEVGRNLKVNAAGGTVLVEL